MAWSVSILSDISVVTVAANASAGATSFTVLDASGVTDDDWIVAGGLAYDVASIAGDVINLADALRSNLVDGDVLYVQRELAINTGSYRVAHETLLDLEASAPHALVMVPMQNRHPAYVKSQPAQRDIALNVYVLARAYQQRRTDYETLAVALASLSGVATLQWTDNNGVIRQYRVVALSVSPDAWFNRASAVLIAPNPYAAQVA